MTMVPPEALLQKRFLPSGTLLLAAGTEVEGWIAGFAAERIIQTAPPAAALDRWADERGVRHIDWLVLHRAGGALAMLEGADRLLRLRRIDFIQFDQDEAAADLERVYALLQARGYSLFRFANRNLEFRRTAPTDGAPATHLAVAPRHWKRLFARDQSMFQYADLFARHGVVPRGIVHVGANEGQEYDGYVEAGCRRVVFIEADPDTFVGLRDRFADNPDVLCINRAVSDRAGHARFARMSGGMSSSLLPPREHLTLYPHITVSGTIEVETDTLPAILAAHGVEADAFNILAMDTQGAERMILAGCGPLLSGFDAVVTEANYAELYEGCGRLADLDDLLFPHGFERVEEISPHHHSWGDAFYVRR
ncbi:FkbM family methyltransferase [Azospirillum griseum]|uniref:FkbM family methyltransferase n=1 Tax=Azospirillum griseum TaxID=2496639 RepID=A0A3S0HVX9_9PROT|nr:FkbM family methyltransferase [Azospirillum griseum]RTR18053.1 FkbM family methyltransferase [Azospirillum griseum]